MLNVIESEKKAMPNDIANLGWRATAKPGHILDAAILPPLPSRKCPLSARGCFPPRGRDKDVVDQISRRINFFERLQPTVPLLGFRQQSPQTAQARACAWKLSNLLPLNVCSTASLNSASNSAHCIPFFALSRHHITAYRYVEAGAQVPCARG